MQNILRKAASAALCLCLLVCGAAAEGGLLGTQIKDTPAPTPEMTAAPTPTPTPTPKPTATPIPTPEPTATPDIAGAPFVLEEMEVYIDETPVRLMVGRDETGEVLYPLCGVLGHMHYDAAYAGGSWQLMHRQTGAEIALMTDGKDGLCVGAMGAADGVVFLTDAQSRVYVYGEEAYVIFDGDAQTKQNDNLFNGIINNEQWIVAPDAYVVKFGYAYFGKDFETYFRASMPEYAEKEKEAIEVYGITSKPGKAKAVAQHCDDVPEFITKLKNELVMVEFLS